MRKRDYWEKEGIVVELVKSLSTKRDIKLSAIINLPKEYNKDDCRKYPLILYLHGSGERGERIEDIKKYGIHRYLDQKDIPAIIVSPQCAENSFWDRYLDDLELLLKEVATEYRVDENRIYLIGISLGAYGAWNFGIQRPDLFAAIVPVAGGVMLPKFLYQMKDVPVWVFHGAGDQEVLVEESIKAARGLREAGGNVKLTIIEYEGHGLCTRVFEREDLYEWLFQQSKEKLMK